MSMTGSESGSCLHERPAATLVGFHHVAAADRIGRPVKSAVPTGAVRVICQPVNIPGLRSDVLEGKKNLMILTISPCRLQKIEATLSMGAIGPARRAALGAGVPEYSGVAPMGAQTTWVVQLHATHDRIDGGPTVCHEHVSSGVPLDTCHPRDSRTAA